jgi:uncharacterized protein YfaS (alpha-2-macroglobulin family)
MYANKLRWVFAFAAILISQLTYSQQKMSDYTEQWKKVEALEKKGLTQSAKAEVLKIYDLAAADKKDAQQIKCCMYLIKYRNMVEEDSRENNIFYVDTLIEKAKVPAKNILQSMQAQMFWQYLQNNRWKFYNRTQLAEEKSKDITTWSIEKLNRTISRLYTASLSGSEVLKNTKLDGLDAIIIKGENTRQLRPTLYDFLAHRALSYFVNDERDVSKAAYSFTIKDDKAFAPAAQFAAASFTTKDTASLYHKAILLLQDIIKFHLADAAPDALIDADIARLGFMKNKAVMEGKDKLYETALIHIETKYPDNATAAQASYLKAALYNERGQQYDPFGKTDNQYEIKRAKEICEAVAKKFPKSEGGVSCLNLLSSITHPSLHVETEKVNLPGQPFRTLVNYKNIPKLYIRIIKTSKEEIKKLDNTDYDRVWNEMVKLKPIKEWSIALPDLKDFQQHSAEIKVDALDNGVYFILAGSDENFSLSKNILAKELIYVSNISFIYNAADYYILNRDNGLPMPNSKVQVWESKYNYKTSRYDEEKAEQYTTDVNGHFTLKLSKEYRNITLQISNGKDELFMSDNLNGYNYYDGYVPPEAAPVTFLFTDRGIYRPGQTVYFKGIVVKTNNKTRKSDIVPNYKTTIELKDVNYQKVSSVEVTSNEFGSFSSTFKLPEGALNGMFTVMDLTNNSNGHFNVEEYKRPKFMVEVQKPKGTYRLNDSIKVTGTAKAYAGNNVDGAKVKYRVVRQVRYPVWWEYGSYRKGGRTRPYPGGGGSSQEITNGETVTNAKGEFKVSFKAIPDESVDKKGQPVFYYEVSADVTDLNGETRSGNTSVAVAYQALQLAISMPGKMPADSLKKVVIRSTNLNDIEEKTTAILSIQKLKAPGRIFRERFWEQPDQFTMSKEEYYNYFPYDVYKNENEAKHYEEAGKVLEKTDSTNAPVSLGTAISSGWYKITATAKDKYGEEVKAIKYVQLTAAADKPSQPLELSIAKSELEPGEKAQYFLNTGFDKIWLVHTLHQVINKKTSSYETLDGRAKMFELPVTEADRGGMGIGYAFVKHNRVYEGLDYFSIPWRNKELDITYNTFRDKLLPGANEKWSIKVAGKKGEKAAAEMLVSMYDASLDQFKPFSWSSLYGLWPGLTIGDNWSHNGFAAIESQERDYYKYETGSYTKIYDILGSKRANDEVEPLWWLNPMDYEFAALDAGDAPRQMKMAQPQMTAAAPLEGKMAAKEVAVTASGRKREGFDAEADGVKDLLKKTPGVTTEQTAPDAPVQVRKSFNETAFFFPDLKTDADGNVEFSFTMPEALTEWKLQAFAHTKELATGMSQKKIITQKQLMVQPNNPRFMREGDRIELSAKVVNLTDKEITGQATLELLDAATGKPVDGWFKNMFPAQYFTAAAGQSVAVKFPMEIPNNFNSALTCRIIAKATGVSDGEETSIPVLINRMLVTESLPINLRKTNSKQFTFDKLLNSGSSSTLSNHAVTVEFTSNPAWYAVQALPYLMEYPYECAEQTFNRYYANALATYISNSMPKIKSVFEKWKNVDTAALLSNLQKNEELKSALLQETPWVMAAQNERQQKKNIALLFDMVKMAGEMDKAMNKLREMQSSNGGFVWFKGGADDRYMTQYIITGIGHLRKLKALNNEAYSKIKTIVDKAIPYLDRKLKEEYDNLLRYKVKLSSNNLSYTAIQYLYMRSFFTEYKISDGATTAVDYYKGQAKKYWLPQSKYMQAMIALALHRDKDTKTPAAILKSLKENAIVKEEMGMYWKEFATGGYYWYQSPIESQAMMVEAFSDIENDANTIDDLKTWLLKNKQTTNWKTTKATAEACYALLLNGSNWLSVEKEVTINLGSTTVKSTDDATEAGTGYFKKRIEGDKVKPAMGNITVSMVPSASNAAAQGSTSWGAVYWQYFEDLDKITSAETPLKLNKKIFIETIGDKGPVLKAINDGDAVKVGDKIKVRIELRVDRDMEYVHMKDMRAACMEPVNVLSGYKWQGGLGYYESTKDASTNFFFGWLARGTYVFEYPLFVTHAGNFSNGITTIQCMYAPEFTSHSEGIRVNAEQ